VNPSTRVKPLILATGEGVKALKANKNTHVCVRTWEMFARLPFTSSSGDIFNGLDGI